MSTLVTLVETFVLVALAFALARRAPEAQHPYGRRLLAIGGLLLAQALLPFAFFSLVLPRVGARDTFHGLAFLTQLVRAGLLLTAFRLWWGLVRPELDRPKLIATLAALLLLAFGSGGTNILGFFVMLIVGSRFKWPREVTGWRRLLVLLGALVLITLLMVEPSGGLSGSGAGSIVTVTSPGGRAWPPPLVRGVWHGGAAVELGLAKPFDHVIEGLASLFFAQLIMLGLRALTLPIRLSGMSLRRRFLVNYLLVSQIPGLLGTFVTIVGAYFAFGILRAGQVRGELERTLARADASAAALLDDAEVARGGPGAVGRLTAARSWLGPDGTRAKFVLREWDATAFARAAAADSAAGDSSDVDSTSAEAVPPERLLAYTPGTPPSLLAFTTGGTADGRVSGAIESNGRIYLVARGLSDTPAPGRALDVFVPLDSTALNALARKVGARVKLTIQRGVTVANEGLSIGPDTSGAAAVVVASRAAPKGTHELFLARSLVPLGDWRAGWRAGLRGAMQLELRITRRLLLRSFADVPGWLFSNIFMLALIGGLLALIGMTQGLAVRTGRTIVQAVEDEVAELRTATARFGAGDLAHRVPVVGRDELSALAGSFNEMAANLERQRRELVEKERMEEELDVARRIQSRFLPQSAPNVAGLDVAGLTRPSREVGGDLFYYVELSEQRLGIALGDVSGKSVPAALLMSNVMSALRAEARFEPVVEHSLDRINREIIDQIEPGRFVTLFYGIVETTGHRLRYTSAGHNPALRLTAQGEIEWLRAGGLPLGVLADTKYPGAETALEPGDTLIVYSDGVTEAEGPVRDGQAELFGDERLVAAVRDLHGQPAEGIARGILAAVDRFAAERPQADDITLVVVRRL